MLKWNLVKSPEKWKPKGFGKQCIPHRHILDSSKFENVSWFQTINEPTDKKKLVS